MKTKSVNENVWLVAPKIGNEVKDLATLQGTFKAAADLGVQHDTWAEILAALNDKIPQGVWITELTPTSSAAGAGGHGPGGTAAATQIDTLIVNGLYHSNTRTMMVDTQRLLDFVSALADLPYFEIDKKNITATLISFGGDQRAFAQKFSMHLKLKTPILLKPETPGNAKPDTK